MIPGLEVNDYSIRGFYPSKDTLPSMYVLCRAKANQVKMFSYRGYKIPKEEEKWLKCSIDDDELTNTVRNYMLTKTVKDTIKEFQVEYTIVHREYKTEHKPEIYPYVQNINDIDENFQIGSFQPSPEEENIFILNRSRQLYEDVTYRTKVHFAGKDLSQIVGSNSDTLRFPEKFVIFVEGSSFDKATYIRFRSVNIELWSIEKLLIDPFQHWLTPMHRIVKPPEYIHLTKNSVMVNIEGDKFKSFPNSSLHGKAQFPILNEMDIAVRFIGAIPGDVVYYESPPIIEQLTANDFGYCRVSGYTFNLVSDPTERCREAEVVDEEEDDFEEEYENGEEEDIE